MNLEEACMLYFTGMPFKLPRKNKDGGTSTWAPFLYKKKIRPGDLRPGLI